MLDRAYSLLEIKQVDEDARIITGMATTPSPDRLQDVVEPRGAAHLHAVHLAHYVELRPAVVVARLFRPVSLAAEPGLALKDKLAREQREVEIEVASRDARLIARALEHQAAPQPPTEPGLVRLFSRR